MNKLLAALAWTLAAPAFAQEDFSKIEVKAIKLTVVTFTGAMSFHLNGEEIRIIHAPRAHTDGDALVHFTGSGPVGSRADLRDYREMLATVSARVRKAVAEGKSDEDIAKPGVTKYFDEKWGKGFLKPEQFTAMLVGGMRKGS